VEIGAEATLFREKEEIGAEATLFREKEEIGAEATLFREKEYIWDFCCSASLQKSSVSDQHWFKCESRFRSSILGQCGYGYGSGSRVLMIKY
jgi:hypothetical protein